MGLAKLLMVVMEEVAQVGLVEMVMAVRQPTGVCEIIVVRNPMNRAWGPGCHQTI